MVIQILEQVTLCIINDSNLFKLSLVQGRSTFRSVLQCKCFYIKCNTIIYLHNCPHNQDPQSIELVFPHKLMTWQFYHVFSPRFACGSFHVKSTHNPHGFWRNLVLTLSLLRHSPTVSFSIICCMASELESAKKSIFNQISANPLALNQP